MLLLWVRVGSVLQEDNHPLTDWSPPEVLGAVRGHMGMEEAQVEPLEHQQAQVILQEMRAAVVVSMGMILMAVVEVEREETERSPTASRTPEDRAARE
jgi:hypothetical protein